MICADEFLMEIRQRKQQHPLEQLIAETAQHPLAQSPLVGIYVVLECTIDENKDQKGKAKHKKVTDLIERVSKNCLSDIFLLDSLVRDNFGQFERIVEKWKRSQSHTEQHDLLTQAMTNDKAVDRRFEGVGITRLARQRCRGRGGSAGPAVEQAPSPTRRERRHRFGGATQRHHLLHRPKLHQKIISPLRPLCNSRVSGMREVA